jgi:glycolate oxidase iron-sulfur subunit
VTTIRRPDPPETPLRLDDDALVTCVACGLCLPHCPTYRVTGLEIASPRGRIAAMRAVEWHAAPIDDAFFRAIDECVQCRGCEPACPSSVPFGQLMEDTRAAVQPRRSRTITRRLAEWIAYRWLLPHHMLLLACTWLLLVGQWLHVVPRRIGLPKLTARGLRPLGVHIGGAPDAWLFTGCVMDAWLRDTHRSTARAMQATGARIARPSSAAACCGALHVHAGRHEEARRLARRVVAAMPGDAPVVVNSAGCGATMKDYGRLLGTPEAHAFAARVHDFSEWIVATGVPPTRPQRQPVIVQDPCHLRHVQKAHGAVRTMLGAAYALRDTDDDGLCCGAGGAYAIIQRELGAAIRDRKVAALARAGAGDPGAIVASANPGCMMHLRAGGIDARHPADLLAAAMEPTDSRPLRE